MTGSTPLIRWIVATVHLLALPLGLAAIWARGRSLRGVLDPAGLKRVFFADAMWGVAAAERRSSRGSAGSRRLLVVLMVFAAAALARGLGV